MFIEIYYFMSLQISIHLTTFLFLLLWKEFQQLTLRFHISKWMISKELIPHFDMCVAKGQLPHFLLLEDVMFVGILTTVLHKAHQSHQGSKLSDPVHLSNFLHYPTFFWRDEEKEKGLGMMPRMTLFSFKKVGHRSKGIGGTIKRGARYFSLETNLL